jgi:hypothetical protein
VKVPGATVLMCSLLASCLGDPYAVGQAPRVEPPPPLPVAPAPESAVQIAAQSYDTCVRTVGLGTFCTGLSSGADGSLHPALPDGSAPWQVQRLSQHNGIGFVVADVVGDERPAMLESSGSLDALRRLLVTEVLRHPDFGGVQGVAGMRGDVFAWTHAGELFCAGECRTLSPGQETPQGAVATLPGIRELALGSDHTCALLANGKVQCWGDNRHAQCGTGSLVGTHPRTQVEWVPVGKSIAAGTDFTCVVQLNGVAFCWGGEGPEIAGGVLHRAADGMTDVTQLTFGALHGCALRTDGAVDCWGMGPAAGSSRPTESLTRVPIPAARRLVSGLAHTCAATEDGAVWCWGGNTYGELGTRPGEAHDATQPVALLRVPR